VADCRQLALTITGQLRTRTRANIQVFLGTPILSDIPLYSPFIKSIKVGVGRSRPVHHSSGHSTWLGRYATSMPRLAPYP
jgi:hypothetical protein